MPNPIFKQFHEDGYLVLPMFLVPQECKELIVAAKILAANIPSKEERIIFSSEEKEQKQLKEEYFLTSNDKIRPFFEKDALNDEGELVVDHLLALNKIGHALHYLHPVFRCYTFCGRVKTVCHRLRMREPTVVQSMYLFKNPKIGSPVKPHQDATYLFAEPVPPVGFWIALEDVTLENGCLSVIPGSHKSGTHRRLVRKPSEENSEKFTMVYDKPCPTYNESAFLPLTVKRGTCIVLHGNLVHKSGPNKSNKTRQAYAFHVIEQKYNNYSPDNWLQQGPNAPFINLYDLSSQFMEG